MKSKKKLIFWIHLILLIVIWTSPFWLDWKLILLGIFLVYIQELIFKSCILTIAQFNDNEEWREMTMYTFIFEKIDFKVNRKRMKFIARFILPWIILLMSLIWQILLNKQVLI